jgi:hypothetical protein
MCSPWHFTSLATVTFVHTIGILRANDPLSKNLSLHISGNISAEKKGRGENRNKEENGSIILGNSQRINMDRGE